MYPLFKHSCSQEYGLSLQPLPILSASLSVRLSSLVFSEPIEVPNSLRNERIAAVSSPQVRANSQDVTQWNHLSVVFSIKVPLANMARICASRLWYTSKHLLRAVGGGSQSAINTTHPISNPLGSTKDNGLLRTKPYRLIPPRSQIGSLDSHLCKFGS